MNDSHTLGLPISPYGITIEKTMNMLNEHKFSTKCDLYMNSARKVVTRKPEDKNKELNLVHKALVVNVLSSGTLLHTLDTTDV